MQATQILPPTKLPTSPVEDGGNHAKEAVIRPLTQEELNLMIVAAGLDTEDCIKIVGKRVFHDGDKSTLTEIVLDGNLLCQKPQQTHSAKSIS
jgi:hypothetical protein